VYNLYVVTVSPLTRTDGCGDQTNRADAATEIYLRAKAFAEAHFGDEILWQRQADIARITESDFLRETAWVIFCTGFRERTLRTYFSYLSLCFCDWESANAIVQCAEVCRTSALAAFNNPRKVDAIIEIARRIDQEGFTNFRLEILQKPIDVLRRLPYIGPITAFHLAKNLGFPVAKPDRHLQRLATALSYTDAHLLCQDIAEVSGDPPQVVDLVLWRFLAEGQDRVSRPRKHAS
jgi:hypothetical protein